VRPEKGDQAHDNDQDTDGPESEFPTAEEFENSLPYSYSLGNGLLGGFGLILCHGVRFLNSINITLFFGWGTGEWPENDRD
jgi:hypothetical protein